MSSTTAARCTRSKTAASRTSVLAAGTAVQAGRCSGIASRATVSGSASNRAHLGQRRRNNAREAHVLLPALQRARLVLGCSTVKTARFRGAAPLLLALFLAAPCALADEAVSDAASDSAPPPPTVTQPPPGFTPA